MVALINSQTCVQLGVPYWQDPVEGKKARWALAGVIALTLGQTGVRWVK